MTESSSKVFSENVVSNDYPMDPQSQNFSHNSTEDQDYDYDIDESFSR